VTAALERLVTTTGVRGAALVLVTRDSVLYERGVGTLTPTSVVPIASSSKWLSAVVIAALLGDGRLSLDETVGGRLPAAPADKRAITLRQLYSHTSGLPALEGEGETDDDGCLADRGTTLAACASQILATPLVAEPGTALIYGGASMSVAARLAELAANTPWTQLFETRVRAPLGLTATTFGVTANPRVSGGAASTGREYARVLQMLLGDGVYAGRRVLTAGAVREMERDQTRGARIVSSPHQRYGHGDYRYGVGVWRDRVAPDGRALQVSSQGAFGFSPWIDRERGVGGVLVVRDALGRVYAAVEELQEVVRRTVDRGR
jgi:CubicO group peptidase (beta-lactamase class C family)